MPRPSVRGLLALGAATAVLLTACATTIDGVALPDPAGVVQTTGSDPSTEDTTTTDTSTSDTDTSSDEPTTDEPTESTEDTTEDTTTVETTDEPTSDDPPTDDPAFPTDELPSAFSTTLPANWPADFALPEGAVIEYASSDDSGSYLYFNAPGAPADVMAFLDGEALGMGVTEFGDYSADGSYSKIYTTADFASLITVAVGEYEPGSSSVFISITAS